MECQNNFATHLRNLFPPCAKAEGITEMMEISEPYQNQEDIGVLLAFRVTAHGENVVPHDPFLVVSQTKTLHGDRNPANVSGVDRFAGLVVDHEIEGPPVHDATGKFDDGILDARCVRTVHITQQ